MLKMDGELKSTDHMQIDSATIPGRCHSPKKPAKCHTIARYFPDVPPEPFPLPILSGTQYCLRVSNHHQWLVS